MGGAGRVASLFQKLARGRGGRIFALFKQTRRQFPGEAFHRRPILPHQRNAAVGSAGEDREIIALADRVRLAREARADLFVSIGTSGAVYPAAGFVQAARYAGARTVEINLEPTSGARLFDEGVYGPATQAVPAFFNTL